MYVVNFFIFTKSKTNKYSLYVYKGKGTDNTEKYTHVHSDAFERHRTELEKKGDY